MQVHTIVALNGPESVELLGKKIEELYKERSLKLEGKPAWLVADNSSARSVSEKVGIVDGTGGIAALVTSVGDYYGRAEPNIWQWMKKQWEAPDPQEAA